MVFPAKQKRLRPELITKSSQNKSPADGIEVIYKNNHSITNTSTFIFFSPYRFYKIVRPQIILIKRTSPFVKVSQNDQYSPNMEHIR